MCKPMFNWSTRTNQITAICPTLSGKNMSLIDLSRKLSIQFNMSITIDDIENYIWKNEIDNIKNTKTTDKTENCRNWIFSYLTRK